MNTIHSYIEKGSFYKAVVEDGSDIIVIIDYAGTLLYHNPSVEEILGYSNLVGKNFFDYILPEGLEAFMQKFEACKAEPYFEKVEFQFRCSDGTYRYLEYNSINLKHKEGIEGFILDCRDISQSKKHAEELLKAQRAKQQFLAKISHEIRTPINGIIGMTNLLGKTINEKDRTNYLNAIKYSAENLKVIINDILDLSLIESDKLKFEKIGFNIFDLLPSVVSTFGFQASEKNNEIVYTINPELDRVLLGDPVRLNQVLINLISNAVKFTHNDKIEISANLLKEDGDVCFVEFIVKDNGIGIKQEKLDHIFESFSQADESITRKYGGTGLGLTISKQLVELQNGRITVESKENEGSVFKFEIPYPIGKPEDIVDSHLSDQQQNTKSSFNNMAVLLVEDNEINRLYAGTILNGWNCTVDSAENGLIALEKIKSGHRYDIILMDIMMPVMDGFKSSRSIRTLNSTIPIIALSATVNKADQEKSIESGMNGFITKPFNPDQLFNLLSKIEKPYINELHELTDSGPLIDLSYLKKISGDNEDFMKDIISTFLKSVPESIDKLEKHVEKKEFKEIHAISHRLKPSFELLGIKNLKDSAIKIEEYVSNDSNHDEVIRLGNQIISTTKKALEELRLHAT